MNNNIKQVHTNNNIKQTKGLQKIEIKRIEAKSARQITFSKRKKGLFQKASELCVLCGAEVAIVIMSPHKRAFTFRHPDTDAVLDRFITGEDNNHPLPAWPRNKELDKVKQDYKLSLKRLEEEEKKHDEVVKLKDKNKANGVLWWDQYSIENMEVEELEHYVKSMERVKNNVAAKIEELSTASYEASFLNQFINQDIEQNNKFNGPLDFGSEFDDLSCLFNDTNGEGFYYGL